MTSGHIRVDFDRGLVEVVTASGTEVYPIGSAEGFSAVSRAWLRSGWDAKYVYGFTWLGRPVIQLPEDMIRIQELIYAVKPSVIVETGVAHGGSLIFYASILLAMGVENARVIGVDIEIRSHNRKAIEEHRLFPMIRLIEGSSIDATTVERVRSELRPDDKVLVMLDSNHTKAHVAAELEAYSPLVSEGSYIVASDGIMEALAGAPRSSADWTWNNPSAAAREFAAANHDFVLEEPPFAFNEGVVRERVTYWPDSLLRCVRQSR